MILRTFGLALLLSGAGLALAHAEVTSSQPADGTVLETAPTEVTLTFSEAVEVPFSTFKVYPLGAEIDSSDPDAEARRNGLAGQLVSEVLEAQGDDAARADSGLDTTEATATNLALPLKADLEPGIYVAMWRVLSVDTHEIQGFLTFEIAR